MIYSGGVTRPNHGQPKASDLVLSVVTAAVIKNINIYPQSSTGGRFGLSHSDQVVGEPQSSATVSCVNDGENFPLSQQLNVDGPTELPRSELARTRPCNSSSVWNTLAELSGRCRR